MSIHATLSAVPFTSTVCTGDELAVQIVVRATEGAINAAQGTLRYNPSLLRVSSVSTGRSVFRFWPVSPLVNTEQGTITFAGGLPTPGYSGDSGLLFTVYAVPLTNTEPLRFTWDAASQVLLNDGLGTSADLSLNGARVTVSEPLPGLCEGIQSTPVPVADTVSPEPFEVIITKTEQGFRGQYFASYYAYDADSGIARYEVRENGEVWHTENSPYLLKLQQGAVRLEVKAVDTAGNERISSTSMMLLQNDGTLWGPWWFWLIAAIATALAIWRILTSRKQTNTPSDTEIKQSSGDSIAGNPT